MSDDNKIERGARFPWCQVADFLDGESNRIELMFGFDAEPHRRKAREIANELQIARIAVLRAEFLARRIP